MKHSVLLDTSFFVRLLNDEDPLHKNAKGYFKYFLEEEIVLKVSTISIAEYCVKGEIHNCSRTIEFAKTKDIQWLDQNITLQTIYYNTSPEYDELNYKRKYVITDTDGNHIDVKDKTVIYVFKNKLISKNEIPEDRNWFYPVRYYKMEEQNQFENIDFIFLVDNSYQERVGKPRLSKRIMRKVKNYSK